MLKWAAQWLRPPTPDEETARLMATIDELRESVRGLRVDVEALQHERDDALADLRLAQTANESLHNQLQASHDNVQRLEMRLKVAAKENELLAFVIERQQSREEKDAAINAMSAEAILQQIRQAAAGGTAFGTEGMR